MITFYYLILFLQYIWGINYLRAFPNLDPIYINLMLHKIRFLPSKTNRQIWKLEKEIDSMIVKVVKQQMKTSYKKDLLQMLLKWAKNSGDYNSLRSDTEISCDKFVVDNCKNIYIVGHETVALTASCCLMLLAAYPKWQDRARAEVLEICKDGIPDADMLWSMKTVCIIQFTYINLYANRFCSPSG